jgi:hypothetical protein
MRHGVFRHLIRCEIERFIRNSAEIEGADTADIHATERAAQEAAAPATTTTTEQTATAAAAAAEQAATTAAATAEQAAALFFFGFGLLGCFRGLRRGFLGKRKALQGALCTIGIISSAHH